MLKQSSMKQDQLCKVKLIKGEKICSNKNKPKKTWLVSQWLLYLKSKEMVTVKILQLELI